MKKKKADDERHAPVFVPKEEQPYEVPANWRWVYLQDVCLIPITDGTHQTPTYCDASTGVPFISAKDVIGGNINWNDIKYITTDLHKTLHLRIAPQVNDILLAKNGTTGVAAIVNTERIFDIYVTLALLRPNMDVVSPNYLLNIINSLVCKNQFDEHLTGIGVPNLHLRDIKRTVIPLAPIREQYRIVDRVERLFAALDAAREKAQAVLAGCETRKAAILHKAFTGELTAGWRARHDVRLDSWQNKTLGSITENLDHRRIPLSKKERDNLERKYDYYGASGIIDKVDRYLFDGTYLLIGEDGANLVTRSKPIAFIASGKYWVNNHAHILSVKEGISIQFLCYYINSIDLLPYITGTAQPKITQAKMNTILISFPRYEEQQEIVRQLDKALGNTQVISNIVARFITQIDALKKTILARAFRGELGTNDPTEPPASL